MSKQKKIISRISFFILSICAISAIVLAVKWKDTRAKTKYEASVALLQPYVDALKAAHPNWIFEYYDTGLEWNDVITNEMTLRRNLVPYAGSYSYTYTKDSNGNNIVSGYTVNSYSTFSIKGVDGTATKEEWYRTPTSWMSTTVSGSYNWSQNNWVLLSGGWVQASEEAVKYVIDPRNWITENNIFSFEKLSFSLDGLSEAEAKKYSTAIKTTLKNMMKNTFMDCSYATVNGSNGNTYANVLYDLGLKYNVSPIYLCTKLLYEKGGAGTYNSSTGKYTMNDTLGLGVSTTDGVNYHKKVSGETAYYNMFNIQAAGTTDTDIINNGGAEAKANGWTTQYKALEGGIQKIASKYIAFGQNTLYFQKWAVSVPANYRYWKQYQQAITAAINEGYNNRAAYLKMDLLESNFTFVIPVYYDMPAEACKRPTPEKSTANPNYKLKALKIVGTDLWGETSNLSITPSFSMDTKSYSLVVPYTISSVNISATPIASTTKVTGAGIKELEVGDNVFKIVCKSEYGTSTTYTVTITRSSGSTLLKSIYDETGSVKLGFDSKVTEYNVEVPYTQEFIYLKYTPESQISNVKLLNAYYEYRDTPVEGMTNLGVSESGVKYGQMDKTLVLSQGREYGYTSRIYLLEGDNKIIFEVYPSVEDTSTKTRYVINIKRLGKFSYDLKDLNVHETYLTNLEVGDTVESVKKKMTIYGGTFVFTDIEGKLKSEQDKIATGDFLEIRDDGNNLVKKYKLVIYGDVNGDGVVDLFDFVKIKNQILRNVPINGIYSVAANASEKSEGIDLFDFVAVKNYILRDIAINQNR